MSSREAVRTRNLEVKAQYCTRARAATPRASPGAYQRSTFNFVRQFDDTSHRPRSLEDARTGTRLTRGQGEKMERWKAVAIDTNCIGEAGYTDMPSTNALVTLGVE